MKTNRKLIILRGIPGAGKSRMAERLYAGATAAVCSADHFFVGADGVYRFDPAKIGDAHGACFREVVYEMRDLESPLIVVDNTNISAIELAPYVLAAQAFGYDHEIVTVKCDAGVAASRNVHGVPAERVVAMATALDSERLAPWWNTRTEVSQ